MVVMVVTKFLMKQGKIVVYSLFMNYLGTHLNKSYICVIGRLLIY